MPRADRFLLPVASCVSPTAVTRASFCLSLAATGSAGGVRYNSHFAPGMDRLTADIALLLGLFRHLPHVHLSARPLIASRRLGILAVQQ